MSVIILQGFVPHYRKEFFDTLANKVDARVYCYETDAELDSQGFKNVDFQRYTVRSYHVGPFMWYNPFKLIEKNSSHVVLMLDFRHVASWVLLLTKFFHKKTIILWGQGISIKRYLKDEKKPLFVLKWMLQLADGVWFYTEKEKEIWQKRLLGLRAVSLDNTISEVSRILELPLKDFAVKAELKRKYNIVQPIVFIFCARFTENRRADLLLEIIEKADKDKFAFIIIGEGISKPCFNLFANVYDFGKVYDFKIKTDLFSIADIYFQPAWLGLSIVEAMAYGLPVFTFKRSNTVLQCVEYHYVEEGVNGHIFKDHIQMLNYLEKINMHQISLMGVHSKRFVTNSLTMESMVDNALSVL